MEHNMTIMEPIHSKFLLCEEKRWETKTSAGLSPTKQMDQEKLKCITTHPIYHRLTHQMHLLHEV
jgi:hypothetical protein